MASSKKTLSRFTVRRNGDAYSMHIEDDAGDVIEFEATADQIDVIVEALDDLLEEDDVEDEDEVEA